MKKDLIIQKIKDENPEVYNLAKTSINVNQFYNGIERIAKNHLAIHQKANDFYTGKDSGRNMFEELEWSDFAAIRILDYIDNRGREFEDLNLRGKIVVNEPFHILYLELKNEPNNGTNGYFTDMYHLFRQLDNHESRDFPTKEKVLMWMDRHPSGLDENIKTIHQANKDRIIKVIIEMMDSGEKRDKTFFFEKDISRTEKLKLVNEWWNSHLFHLRFAIKSIEILNRMLKNSLDDNLLDLMKVAKDKGIPIFVTPYYLSLIIIGDGLLKNSDIAIRQYMFYSRELIDEFGYIVAWEKEDIVKPGEPNAAGWLLPTHHNIHRRYPEVAILIPDTIGRACGGLCASCQRMYDFQSGHLNFNLDKLRPNERWPDKLKRLMVYWSNDSQLRDILVTGGDALMSRSLSIKRILDEIYNMALIKIEANRLIPDGKKHAEILRVRLGTRLLAYLPMRINDHLLSILKEFKDKASQIGIKQFVIQTHFETAMEITPMVKSAVSKLNNIGWTVTNQLVFTAGASRRGHTIKLRKELNDIGVLTYYTFSVKGYKENSRNFATNARAVQEQLEEKIIGKIPQSLYDSIKTIPENAKDTVELINNIRKSSNIPFLATDRNVLNLPGVGKSLTYRVIGICNDGRRILEFDHDHTRAHSPIINKIGKIVIIESRSVRNYLEQMEQFGEDMTEYNSLYGYSIGESEERMPIFEYPEYDFDITDEYTNISID